MIKESQPNIDKLKSLALSYSKNWCSLKQQGKCLMQLNDDYGRLINEIKKVSIGHFKTIDKLKDYFKHPVITSCIIEHSEELGIGILFMPKGQ